jgi:hypothetical protein
MNIKWITSDDFLLGIMFGSHGVMVRFTYVGFDLYREPKKIVNNVVKIK